MTPADAPSNGDSRRPADGDSTKPTGGAGTASAEDTRFPSPRRAANVLGLIALVVVVALVVIAAVPGVIGMADSYVVRSSSMSPSIDAGSVVFVSSVDAADVEVGDVITFLRSNSDSRVTHRVVDVRTSDGDRAFKTKGDANEEADPGYVGQHQVVGKVAFSVPLLGYLLAFAQSRLGIVALLIVPGVLLAANELWGLYREAGTPSQGGDGR